MPPFKYPGPICQTKDWYDSIEDGTLARMPSPLPSPLGSPTPQGSAKKVSKGIAPAGACSFINPRDSGTVIAPKKAFDRLRKNSGVAKISPPKSKTKQTWVDGSTSESAIEQEIQIDGQKITVIRPTEDEAKNKNLPTTEQVAEALRAVPAKQRAYTKEVIVSPKASPKSTKDKTIAGEGGSADITLFPVSTSQSQVDFDNRLMHENGHNFQAKLWHDTGDVGQWQIAADADKRRPSPYALETTGDDFCEFNILYNTAKGTSCEAIAKQIYPNRWEKREGY